ncbi:MAG: hemolysin family protein [Bacteroidales bacterium]|nr:hemolysin family protein [Bacteroidales bacterium]
MTPWIIITVVSLVCSALFSGTEIAYITADRVRTQIDVKRGGLLGRIIHRFYSDTEFFISSILVGNNVMLVIYGMGAAYFLEPWITSMVHDNEALLLIIQTLISTMVILLTGEFLPKTIFRINPNSSLKLFAIPIYCFYIIFYPLSWLTNAISKALMRLVGIKETKPRLRALSVGDLNDYLEESIDSLNEKKEAVENEVKIFHNALDFSTTHLRDCMLPRNEIVAVNNDTATRQELVRLFTSSGRSKILVYRDDIDTILGYIHVSELLRADNDWHEHINPVLFAPETLLANVMMRRLLSEKRSIAIVVDEFGGTAGMVTLEDLVEEIFGDIRDEHDKPALTARAIAPDVYEFAGRCEISHLNEAFNLDIPEDDDYQTIAGYILNATGTIPDTGETVILGNFKFEILKKSANRLELLRVTRMALQENENE